MPPLPRPRAANTELTPQLRSRICQLRELCYSYGQIAKILPHIKKSTIITTCRREALRDDNVTRPRSGPPRKLSEEDRDHLYDIIKHQDAHIQHRDLLHEVDDKIKVRSLQRLLREMGLRKWRQLKRPELKPHHAEARLQWARTYEYFTEEDWKRVCWSDECTVERGVGRQPTWTFNRPSEQLEKGDVQTVNGTTHGVKKMLWAAFKWNQRTGLVPLDGDPLAARGGVSSWVIQYLYRSFLPTIIGEEDIFMHDGAGPHRGHIVLDVLRELGIHVMVWPPYSPDLNPIENLWSIMKREIYKNHPELEHAPDTDETLIDLVAAARRAWHQINLEVLASLALTMPHRVKAIIQANGWYTKY